MLDVNSMSSFGDIVVRASDTVILVILLYHLQRVNSNIWMEVGKERRGNRRYTNVSATVAEIGIEFCAV